MSSSQSSETVNGEWWYDPQESERDEEHPKFFDETCEEVIVGIKQREPKMNLSKLCGVYRWTYEFPDPGDTEASEVVYPAKSQNAAQNPNYPGSLTITCPTGKKATLKNITGKVVHFGKEATFSGIKRARTRDGTALDDNHWEFCVFHWKKQYGDNQDEGNSLFALAVDDDAGEPFVMFRYASPARGGGDMYLDIAAKKERRRTGSELSRTERVRLGMGLTYPEVRTAALKAAAAAQEGDESGDESGSSLSSDDEADDRKRKHPRDERGARKKRRSV